MPRLIFDEIQGLLEAPSVALFGFRQSLKPVGDFVESFVPRAAGHARIHVGIFVGLTGDRGTQVVARRTNRLSSGGISRFLEIFEMPVRVPGLALRSGTENGRNVIDGTGSLRRQPFEQNIGNDDWLAIHQQTRL